jgi:hypothetical protein
MWSCTGKSRKLKLIKALMFVKSINGFSEINLAGQRISAKIQGIYVFGQSIPIVLAVLRTTKS